MLAIKPAETSQSLHSTSPPCTSERLSRALICALEVIKPLDASLHLVEVSSHKGSLAIPSALLERNAPPCRACISLQSPFSHQKEGYLL